MHDKVQACLSNSSALCCTVLILFRSGSTVKITVLITEPMALHVFSKYITNICRFY